MRIGKTGGAVAALALVSFFIFGGVAVAHAAAPLTLVPFDSTGSTNPTLVVHGTAEPGAPITVTATSIEATDAPYCETVADPGGSWYCTKDTPGINQVHFGSNVLTVTDGTSAPVSSAAITLYGAGGPILTSPQSGKSILPNHPVFTGFGPARGSISVIANDGETVCTVDPVPDSETWSCSPATLPLGANTFTVRSTTPGYPTVGFDTRDSNPTAVTVSDLAAPVMSYTMGYSTGTSSAPISFQNGAVGTDLYSITEPTGEGNGYVRSPYPDPSCGPSAGPGALVCDFGILAPGIWEAHSYQYVGEMSPAGQNDFFRIPEAPTMTATAQPDQTVAFFGTGTTGDLISVVTDPGATVCTATVAANQWGCSAAATLGTHSYQAAQLDQGWTPYLDNDSSGNVMGDPLGTVLNGRSALTAPTSVTVVAPPAPPAPPAMRYDFGAASVTITATGDPTGEGSGIEVYSVDDGAGSGYSFTSYPACVALSNEGEDGGFAPQTSIPTTQTCSVSNLTPGVWNIYSAQRVNGTTSSYQNDYFRVPDAPSIQARSGDSDSIILSGTGTTGDIVTALQDGTPVCQATVAGGAWTCIISSTSGTHSYTASQLDQGFAVTDPEQTDGLVYNARSAFSASAALVVASVPPASVPPTSAPQAPPGSSLPAPTIQTLFFWALNIVGGDGPLHAGDTVTVSSSGLPVGALVSFELHSTPRSLGTMTVAPDGTFSRTITIPDDVDPGNHHIVVTVTPQGEAPSPQEAAITVVPVAPAAASSTASGDTSTAVPKHQNSHHSEGNRNTLSTPSSFTHALPTLATLFENPGTLAVAVGLALAIMLLAALPTEILDSAVSSNLDRFGPFLSRAGSWAERTTAWLNRVTHSSAASSAIMIVLSSIIFGFADPDYGFNLVSVRLTLSIIVGLYVVYYIAPRISGVLIKRRWGLESEISIQPIALVFAIFGVIVGRLLGFSPGFLIGLAIGLELAANAKTLHKARSMAVQVSVIVGLALLAWLGYSLIALGGESSVWTGLVQDALTTITAEGLTGMLLGLFPLAFFEGKEVWDYSKRLWTGLFMITGTAFALLVLPTAVAPQKIGESLPAWLLVLGCFTVVSLGVWLYLKLTTKPEQEIVEAEPERVEA